MTPAGWILNIRSYLPSLCGCLWHSETSPVALHSHLSNWIKFLNSGKMSVLPSVLPLWFIWTGNFWYIQCLRNVHTITFFSVSGKVSFLLMSLATEVELISTIIKIKIIYLDSFTFIHDRVPYSIWNSTRHLFVRHGQLNVTLGVQM